MPLPIVLAYYAAAGACAAVGAAGGKVLYDRAKQEEALAYAEAEKNIKKKLLENEIELEQLREQARQAGLDPDEVERGYEALKSDQVTPNEVRDFVLEAMSTGSSTHAG